MTEWSHYRLVSTMLNFLSGAPGAPVLRVVAGMSMRIAVALHLGSVVVGVSCILRDFVLRERWPAEWVGHVQPELHGWYEATAGQALDIFMLSALLFYGALNVAEILDGTLRHRGATLAAVAAIAFVLLP